MYMVLLGMLIRSMYDLCWTSNRQVVPSQMGQKVFALNVLLWRAFQIQSQSQGLLLFLISFRYLCLPVKLCQGPRHLDHLLLAIHAPKQVVDLDFLIWEQVDDFVSDRFSLVQAFNSCGNVFRRQRRPCHVDFHPFLWLRFLFVGS